MASAHGFSSLEFVLFSVASCQDGFCSFCYGAESLPPMYYYTVVKHSYFTFSLKKKKFYTFLGTWSGFALPRRQFPVLISLKVWIFFDLLRFFGVLWLIFFFLFFAITLHYNLPKQHKLVWDCHQHHNCLHLYIWTIVEKAFWRE